MQTDSRLPSHLWVAALIRRAEIAGAMAMVSQKGDAERGDVLIKIDRLDGTGAAFRPGMAMDGNRVFQDITTQGVESDMAALEAYIQRAKERDSDLWVIEIEDRHGRHFITEAVEGAQSAAESDAENFFNFKRW